MPQSPSPLQLNSQGRRCLDVEHVLCSLFAERFFFGGGVAWELWLWLLHCRVDLLFLLRKFFFFGNAGKDENPGLLRRWWGFQTTPPTLLRGGGIHANQVKILTDWRLWAC